MNPIYRIGTTQAGMVSLESLGLPIPKASPTTYSAFVPLGDGTVAGVGWKKSVWRFAFLSMTQVAILRAYCAGTSATVYVQTMDVDGAYSTYSAIMVWPDNIQLKGDNVLDFAIELRAMVKL